MLRANRPQSPPPSSVQQRRIRAVEVARGRTGYGFTLSGQNPCVLSCILKGSPADYVGLRSGDHILSVNDINVSKASHEDVVKLIGRCAGILKLVIGEQRGAGGRHHSSNLDGLSRGGWLRPKMDSKQLGINRAERVVAELQSGGIFNMIFENSSHSSSSSDKDRPGHTSSAKARPMSDPEFPPCRNSSRSHSNPVLLSEEEMAQEQHMDVGDGRDLVLDPNQDIVNVGMIVGYLGSIELASTGTSLESDSLQAIRGCMRRLRAEQKIHSLVLMKVMHDSVRLCSDKGQILATYPAEKLAFSACCPDDRRFFGLVTMQATDDECHLSRGRYEEEGLRTSCHVFIVDPDLCYHQVHLGVARRFGFECTPDSDTGGCLEFPPTSQSLLHFVSVLYRDMGDNIEGVRARAFLDPDNDAQQNHSTSSNSDSGIGNFLPEEKSNRVLLVDLGGPLNHNHVSGPRHWDSPPSSQQAWSPTLGAAAPQPPPPPPTIRNSHYRHEPYLADLPQPLPGTGGGVEPQRWLPVHVLRDWHQQHHHFHGLSSDQESYAESTDGWSSANCSTLPPPMNKIPADRYRTHTQRLKDEWAKKLFGAGDRERSETVKKRGGSGRFRGLTMGFPPLSHRSSARRSFGRSKRLSLARSLDDLEVGVCLSLSLSLTLSRSHRNKHTLCTFADKWRMLLQHSTFV
uniref:Regulator of G protein signaling 12b n=1 Tax=Hippocampus comes TaxID=109280 RepID=A0A3Q2Z6E1_HIPCM